jgi:hypothetical protein
LTTRIVRDSFATQRWIFRHSARIEEKRCTLISHLLCGRFLGRITGGSSFPSQQHSSDLSLDGIPVSGLRSTTENSSGESLPAGILADNATTRLRAAAGMYHATRVRPHCAKTELSHRSGTGSAALNVQEVRFSTCIETQPMPYCTWFHLAPSLIRRGLPLHPHVAQLTTD